MGARDMSSANLATEWLEKVGPSIHAVTPFGRAFLSKMNKLCLCAGSSGGVGGALLTLAMLTILAIGDPTPTPTPVPLPF